MNRRQFIIIIIIVVFVVGGEHEVGRMSLSLRYYVCVDQTQRWRRNFETFTASHIGYLIIIIILLMSFGLQNEFAAVFPCSPPYVRFQYFNVSFYTVGDPS